MKFKKGMQVRVKTREEALAIYGPSESYEINMTYGYVPNEMNKWLNKVVTIRTAGIDSVTLEEVGYTWHEDMFKSRTLLSFKNLYEN